MSLRFLLVVRPDGKVAYTATGNPEVIVLTPDAEREVFTEMVKAGFPEIMPEDILPGFGAKGRLSATGWTKLVSLSRKAGGEIIS